MTKRLKDYLVGVSRSDPVTFVIIPISLTMVAILASFIPADRAAPSDSVPALRHD